MSKPKRIWTAAKKLEIVEFYKQHGLSPTLREYEIVNSMLYRWVDKYDSYGEEGLKTTIKKASTDLELENAQLKRELKEYKQMVAEQHLELRIKNDLLKKKKSALRKKE